MEKFGQACDQCDPASLFDGRSRSRARAAPGRFLVGSPAVKWKAPPPEAAGEGDFIAGRRSWGAGAQAAGAALLLGGGWSGGSVPGHFTVGLAWPSKPKARDSSHEKYLCPSRTLVAHALVRLVRAGRANQAATRVGRCKTKPARAFRLLLPAARKAPRRRPQLSCLEAERAHRAMASKSCKETFGMSG